MNSPEILLEAWGDWNRCFGRCYSLSPKKVFFGGREKPVREDAEAIES